MLIYYKDPQTTFDLLLTPIWGRKNLLFPLTISNKIIRNGINGTKTR